MKRSIWNFFLLFIPVLTLAVVTSYPSSLAQGQIPQITDFSPKSGSVGTTVTITGRFFTGTTGVQFNNVNATSFQVNSDTQITTTVPTGAITGPIRVISPNGTGNSSESFTVSTASDTFSITSFTPRKGPVGTTVTLIGVKFTGVTEVQFNGTKADTFNVVSDTQITANVPSKATTGPIKVIKGTDSATSTLNFTVQTGGGSACKAIVTQDHWKGEYFANRDLSGKKVLVRDDTNDAKGMGLNFEWAGSPGGACGVPEDNFSVRWTRTVNFPAGSYMFQTTIDDGVRLYLDDIRILNHWDDTGLHTNQTTWTLTAGNHKVIMEYQDKGGTAVAKLSWSLGQPVVKEVSPSNGAPGTLVRIKGSGFFGVTEVRFNQTKAVTYTLESADLISVLVPINATSGKVSVVTPGGTGSSSGDFTIPTMCSTGIPIKVGQSVTGSLDTNDCPSAFRGGNYYADRFTFTGKARQFIVLQANSTTFNSYLYLFNPSGQIVAQDDDGGGGTNARIPAGSGFFRLIDNGVYTVEITSFSEKRTGAYTLTLTESPASPTSDLSSRNEPVTSTFDCPSQALRLGEDIQGSLETNDCQTLFGRQTHFVDQYSFHGATGQKVSIALTSSVFEPFLNVRGPDGTSLKPKRVFGTRDKRVLYVLPMEGSYTVEISSQDPDMTGGYLLRLYSDFHQP